jgi:PAS domain S-box-containing protein
MHRKIFVHYFLLIPSVLNVACHDAVAYDRVKIMAVVAPFIIPDSSGLSEAETESLQRINTVINTTLDLQEVLRRIVNEIVALLGAQSASVILHDETTQEAEVLTSYGTASSPSSLRYPLAGSLTGWVALHQKPLRAFRLTPEEWPTSWRLGEQLGEPPVCVSVLLVPLWVQGKAVGCLDAVWKPHHHITDREETLLQAIAVQAAIAITNARLYQEKEKALQETQQTLNALQASEARYRALAENTYDLICELDQEGRYVYLSPNYPEVLGYAFDELLDRSAFELVHPDDLPGVLMEFAKQAGKVTLRVLHKSGEWRWFESTGKEYTTLTGEKRGVIVSRDISERKQAEEQLTEEMALATALARIGQEMMASLDKPVILEKLCQLTASVLNCDCSCTLLWQPQENAYIPVAHHGHTPEQWETFRLLRIPTVMWSDLLTLLQQKSVVQVDITSQQHTPLGKLAHQDGFTACLCIALRRGSDLIGVQIVAARAPKKSFTSQQRRLAQGIAHIASLTLANALLLEELTQANRLKEDFLGTVSHELRTPLNIIIGYNQLMREETFGLLNAEQQDILERVGKNATELLELINTILDLSRLQNRRTPLTFSKVNVSALLTDLQADMIPLQKDTGPAVDWTYPPDLPLLCTDPLKLKMVLKNLLTNALKFTDEGRISVAARPYGAGIEFSVADTGIGIAPEDLPHIFEPFRQGKLSLSQHRDGVGLGLYIVRQILDLLGGTISVESERGKGSIFRVWAPQG